MTASGHCSTYRRKSESIAPSLGERPTAPLIPVKRERGAQDSLRAMRILLALLLVLAAPVAPAQAPDFTALVRDAGAAVVALSGGQSMVYADLPLAEDQAAAEEDEEPALLRGFLRRDYGPAPDVRALGPGFVIDPAGYIITNAHLVAERRDVRVRLADRREFEARVIGADPLSDIALVKIEADGLPQVRI